MPKDIRLLSHRSSSVSTARPAFSGTNAVGNSVHFDADGEATDIPDDVADEILSMYPWAEDITEV